MGMWGSVAELFRRTENKPPPFPGGYAPTGLDQDDDSDMLASGHSEAVAGRAAAWRESLASIGKDIAGTALAIEYVDSKGNASRRRISLGAIQVDERGRVFLQAYCMERRALRSFRMDRVHTVIDVDGEVHEPHRYFSEILRIDMPDECFATAEHKAEASLAVAFREAPPPVRDAVPGRAQRHAARDGLRVLAALARSDGIMHDAEIEVILDYIAHRADCDGIAMGEEDRDALIPYLRRQYPTTDVLDRCLAALEEEPRSQQRLLIRHAIQLMDADGVQDPAEFDLLLRIQNQLGG